MEPGIESLIAGGETYTVEFKSDVNDDELTEASVCLANGDGGQILIGVADDGTLVGARARHGDTTEPRRLEALIANKTSPALIVEVATERCGGLDVVIVDVPKARTLVATTAGRYVRRAIGVDGSPQCQETIIAASLYAKERHLPGQNQSWVYLAAREWVRAVLVQAEANVSRTEEELAKAQGVLTESDPVEIISKQVILEV